MTECGEQIANAVCREEEGHDGLHVSKNSDGSVLRWTTERNNDDCCPAQEDRHE